MTVSIKWLGHASFQVEDDGKIVYVDPHEGEQLKRKVEADSEIEVILLGEGKEYRVV